MHAIRTHVPDSESTVVDDRQVARYSARDEGEGKNTGGEGLHDYLGRCVCVSVGEGAWVRLML